MKHFAILLVLLAGCHVPNVKYRAPARTTLTDIRDVVYGLFWAYEMEDAFRFEEYVSGDFRSADISGSAHTMPWFTQAVRDDFRNLDNPRFEVYVESAVPFEDGNLYRLRLRWFRRATIPSTGAEWILREQDSALLLKKENGEWKLWGIEGDPIFGVSDAFGRIVIRSGTINGAAASGSIESGRLE